MESTLDGVIYESSNATAISRCKNIVFALARVHALHYMFSLLALLFPFQFESHKKKFSSRRDESGNEKPVQFLIRSIARNAVIKTQ